MDKINYTSILQELYIDLKEDDLYVCEEDREEAFIYLGIRDIHRAARENIRLEESKQIVYDNDVLEIIKKWENQSGRSINGLITYSDLALVHVIDELMKIFQEEYCITHITYDNQGGFCYPNDYSCILFSWSHIYLKDFN